MTGTQLHEVITNSIYVDMLRIYQPQALLQQSTQALTQSAMQYQQGIIVLPWMAMSATGHKL